MQHKTITRDVRDDLRNGREPFSRIMSAAAALSANEELLVIAPFEPVPLFRIMEKHGFQHSTRPAESGDWEVRFTRRPEAQPAGSAPAAASDGPCGCSAVSPAGIVEVDARGLEPPQPMVKILETTAALPAGVELRARTDRRPMHLYPHLEERGFTAQTEEQSDGSFLTHIRRG